MAQETGFSSARPEAYAARGHDPARQAFLVQNPRIGGAGFKVRLVTANAPIRCIHDLAAILNAGIGETLVVVGGDLVAESQLKIRRRAVLPN